MGLTAAILATGGLAAGPLAGTALGAILGTAAVGAAVGAVSSAAIYTGVTLATGGTWSLEGMAQATAIGALIGGVTAGAGKAFELWRAGTLFAEEEGAVEASQGMSNEEITQRLTALKDQARGTATLTDNQLRALADHPELRQAFLGERIDLAFRNLVNLPENADLLNYVELTPRGVFGPDVVSLSSDTWWDVTTPGQWAAHVAKYTPEFGEGIPLLY